MELPFNTMKCQQILFMIGDRGSSSAAEAIAPQARWNNSSDGKMLIKSENIMLKDNARPVQGVSEHLDAHQVPQGGFLQGGVHRPGHYSHLSVVFEKLLNEMIQCERAPTPFLFHSRTNCFDTIAL